MSNNRFSRLVAAIPEKPLEIEALYVLKLGCIRFTDRPIPSSKYPISESQASETDLDSNEKKETSIKFETIVDALKNCKNIFDLNIPSPPTGRKNGYDFTDEFGTILASKRFTARIDLPRRLHKFAEEYDSPDQVIEQFNVISTGSLFAAYSQIDKYPVWPFFANEFRDIVRNEVESHTSIKAPLFGPSPIHPEIYVALRKSRKNTPKMPIAVYTINKSICLVVDRPRSSIPSLMEYIFDICLFPISRFYLLQIQRSRLLRYNTEIQSHFNDISSSIETIQSSRFWQLSSRNKASISAHVSLSKFHLRMVGHDSLSFSMEQDQSHLKELLKDNRFLSGISDYFDQESDAPITSSMSQAISFYQSEIQSYANVQSVLASSFIGAIIGSLLTAFLTMK